MMTTEIELLTLLSRLNPDMSVLEKAQSLINSAIKWDVFLSLSCKHATVGLVYKNLLRLKNVPLDTKNEFKRIYINILTSNILNFTENKRLIEEINKTGIEVISLKGAIVSEKIFGDLGLYPSGDIDILVKVKDIDKTLKLLESKGYQLKDKGFDRYRDFFIKELYHISLSNGKYLIEPHWNLFFRYFTTPPQFWWDESIVISYGGRQYLSLSPEKNILYTSFRLFIKAFNQLRFLVIISEIIKYYGDEIDWDKMFVYAKEYGFENVLLVVLRLSSHLLGAPVPERYIKVEGIRVKALYKYVNKMILRGGNLNPIHKVLLIFLKDDMAGAFGVLLCRLFPSMGEIISRYKLSYKYERAVVYYILNPLFLLMGKHQK